MSMVNAWGKPGTLTYKARHFAAFAHSGQRRKYTDEPYILHPESVAWLVAEGGGTEQMVAAAWLHDVLEDTIVTQAEIYVHFGFEVSQLVRELTDVYTSALYPDMNRGERKRLEAERLAGCSHAARTIKRCDMADNTRSIVEHDPGFAAVYLEEKAYLLGLLNEADDHDAALL